MQTVGGQGDFSIAKEDLDHSVETGFCEREECLFSEELVALVKS